MTPRKRSRTTCTTAYDISLSPGPMSINSAGVFGQSVKGDIVETVTSQHVFPLILESVLFSFYTTLIMFYGIKYWSGKRHIWPMFTVSIILYSLCMICWLLDLSILWKELYYVIPNYSSNDTSVDQILRGSDGNMKFARSTCELAIFVLSDTVALWRAYVIYGRQRCLRLVFSVITVLYIALCVLTVIVHDTLFLANPPAIAVAFNRLGGGQAALSLGAVTGAWSLCIQVLATAMIARMAFLRRKEIKDCLSDDTSSLDHSRLVGVLYIVVETGIIYIILFMIYLLLTAEVFARPLGGAWAEYWICQLSGIYPTLIIVVVSLRSSILERSTMITAASDMPVATPRLSIIDEIRALPYGGPTGGSSTRNPMSMVFDTEKSYVDAESSRVIV